MLAEREPHLVEVELGPVAHARELARVAGRPG